MIAERKKENSTLGKYPMNLPGQLVFRDMYFGAQATLGYSFAQEPGNKICRFVDWHLRSNVSDTPVGEHRLDGTYAIDSPAGRRVVLAVEVREDGLSVHRYADAAVAAGGVDPPSETARGGVFPDAGRMLCALGKGSGGV